LGAGRREENSVVAQKTTDSKHKKTETRQQIKDSRQLTAEGRQKAVDRKEQAIDSKRTMPKLTPVTPTCVASAAMPCK
jgi:hypothetical protein